MGKDIVIVGWPGIGKTELVKSNKGYVDLDYPGRPMPEYIEEIRKALVKGKKVLLPSWQKLRDALHDAGIAYTLVLPARDLKTDYLVRYMKRGSEQKMIDVLNKNWEVFWDGCGQEPCFNKVIMQRSGDYLMDFISEIESRYVQ